MNPEVRSICLDCGAPISAAANYCWMCGRRVLPPVIAQRSSDSLAVTRTAARHFDHRATTQFSVATLLLIVTLSAVVLGIFAISPGLGVVVLIVLVPALIRVAVRSSRAQGEGRPLSGSEKLKTGCRTAALAFAILAGVVALSVTALVVYVLIACSHFRIG